MRTKKHNVASHLLRLACALAVVAMMTLVFVFRYEQAFSMPNFYAEDGTVFTNAISEHGLLGAMLTAFNGYLVVGQYIIAGLSFLLLAIMGGSFADLPFFISLASCVFLGATAALPFLLFRREMGWKIALLTSLLLAFVPMPGSDYAVIGTLGNLKFAFMVWAVLFVIYRIKNQSYPRRVFLGDVILLVCVLTNITTVAILPAILWPYRKRLFASLRSRLRDLRTLIRIPGMMSALILLVVSFVYVAIVYLKGIPVMPNYLDTPYMWEATDNIVYRVTVYAVLFLAAGTMTDKIAILLILALLVLAFIVNKKRRLVLAFVLYAIAVSTISFVITRTGIGDHMLDYLKSPDQFFYAQSMLMLFAIMWAVVPYLKTVMAERVLILGVGIFLLVTAPYGSSYGRNSELYKSRGDIYSNLEQACKKVGKDESVIFHIYPSEPWNMKVATSTACKR